MLASPGAFDGEGQAAVLRSLSFEADHAIMAIRLASTAAFHRDRYGACSSASTDHRIAGGIRIQIQRSIVLYGRERLRTAGRDGVEIVGRDSVNSSISRAKTRHCAKLEMMVFHVRMPFEFIPVHQRIIFASSARYNSATWRDSSCVPHSAAFPAPPAEYCGC